mgnify:CR=1 FL=1
MTQWISIAGRKRHDGIDFYSTPEWCVRKLLEHQDFEWPILEPCSGSGAISKVLEEKYTVVSQDIRTDPSVYGERWVDFFAHTGKYPTIVTNPPYFCAKDFILHALEIAETVCVLLKLQFLESVDRYDFFQNTPLSHIYVLSKRPTMYPDWEPEPKNGWTIAYAWYIWKQGYAGEPVIKWIK